MKFIIVLALTLSSAFADECTQQGKDLSEKWVREDVQGRFGVDVKIEAFTKSSVSNIYSNKMICHYETLYTFKALDQQSGLIKRFIGNSVMNNDGLRPFYPIREVATGL